MVQGRHGLLDDDARLEEIEGILLVSGVDAVMQKFPDLQGRKESLKYRRKKLLKKNGASQPTADPKLADRLRVLRAKPTNTLTEAELDERMELESKVGGLVTEAKTAQPEAPQAERPKAVDDQLAQMRKRRLAQQAQRKKEIAASKKDGNGRLGQDGTRVKARQEILVNLTKHLEERREKTAVLESRAQKQQEVAEEKRLVKVNKANQVYVHGKDIPEAELDALRTEAVLAKEKAEDLRRGAEASQVEEEKIERQLAEAGREVKTERLAQARVRTRSLCVSFDKELASLRDATAKLANADVAMMQLSEELGLKYTGFVRDNRSGADCLAWKRIEVELWEFFKGLDRSNSFFMGRSLVDMAEESFKRVESRLQTNER